MSSRDILTVHGLKAILLRFPTPHPSMASFVAVIKAMSAEYVRRVADVSRGRGRCVIRERIVLPPVVDTISDIDSVNDEALPLPT
ncbi:unnamed protein product [Phytophthora fragariaefolia]|uniref:Unnamed protein product n=1 Tax=Phytophthora fragariaefolia TaxID=1490495 RepID=A0A9W7CYT8_9STRA|nr:unnamed protein product [Phytophthora fragariaefolia]